MFFFLVQASRQSESRRPFSEIVPVENRASILRRQHGEQRRQLDSQHRQSDSFTDIWSDWEDPRFALVESMSQSMTFNPRGSGIQTGLQPRVDR